MTLKELTNAMTIFDFKAFPQKNNPKAVTMSVGCGDGERYFITAKNVGTKETPIWNWVPGERMRSVMAQENKEAADLGPVATL